MEFRHTPPGLPDDKPAILAAGVPPTALLGRSLPMVGSAHKCHPTRSAKVRNTSAEFPPRPPKSRVPSPTIWARMAARARVRQRQLSLASCAFVMPCRRRAHHPCRKYLSRRSTTAHRAHGGAPTMQTDAWNCVLTYSARARARGEGVTTKHTSSQAHICHLGGHY